MLKCSGSFIDDFLFGSKQENWIAVLLCQPTELPHEIDARNAFWNGPTKQPCCHNHGSSVSVYNLASTYDAIHSLIITHLKELVGINPNQMGKAAILNEPICRLNGLSHRPRVNRHAKYLNPHG